MGFDCSISRVKKFNKDYPLEKFIQVNRYLNWKNNPWNIEERTGSNGEVIPAPYPTYEKYWRANNLEQDKEYPGIPTQEEIDFYQEIYSANQAESTYNDATTTIESWCSSGRTFDSDIITYLEKIDQYTFGPFTPESLKNIIEYVDKELESCKTIPVIISECFKINEDGTKTLIPCDGVIAINTETGEERKIYTSDEYEGEYLYAPTAEFEEDKYYALTSLKEALIKVSSINLEEEFVWYERGW